MKHKGNTIIVSTSKDKIITFNNVYAKKPDNELWIYNISSEVIAIFPRDKWDYFYVEGWANEKK